MLGFFICFLKEIEFLPKMSDNKGRYLNTYLNKYFMARRKLENKNIRKISRIGNRSLGVTIPVDFLRQLRWREKQKVVVKKTHGGVIIRDWKR